MTREELEEMLAKLEEKPTETTEPITTTETTEPITTTETTEAPKTEPEETVTMAEILTILKGTINENKELKEALNKHFKTSPTPPDKIEKPITTIEPDVKTLATEFVNREGSFVNRYLKEHGIEKETK